MTWAHPSLLALLGLVPVVLVLVVWAWRARARALGRLIAHDVLGGIVPPGILRRRGWQASLAVLATVGLATAAAGPQLGFDWEQRRMEGVSIVVALDVSRSMDARDVSPSRLGRARQKLTDLAGMLRGDAVGLVLFADGAWVRTPLTVDYDTFLWSVTESGTDSIQAQGTSLSGALDAATRMLQRAPGTGKAILVVSDGEVHQPTEEVDAALERAVAAGVHVYGLGLGTPEGAPIPLAEGGFKKDGKGDVVLTRLDEGSLRRLAEASGGAYVRAVPSDGDVRALYEDEIRGKLEATERGVRRDKVPRERYQWPLAGALGAMVIGAALSIRGRAGARVVLLFATLLGLGLSGPALAGPREEGLAALKAERWEEAIQALGAARVEDPWDAEVGTALATALYRAGRYREAEQLYESLAESASDPRTQATHRYNAGNAAYRGGRLDEALADYTMAQEAQKDFAPAQKNAEAVRKEIEARKAAPPKEPPKDGQDGQQAPPQAGQGGEQGQPEDGQPQQGPPPNGQPQGGQPQDGQPQDGQPQPGQPPNGQSPQGQSPQGAPQDGQPPQGRGPDAQGSPDGQPGATAQGTPDPSTPPDAEGAAPAIEGEGAPTGDMTAEQAGRLVDGVPDGKPRVVRGGAPAREDW